VILTPLTHTRAACLSHREHEPAALDRVNGKSPCQSTKGIAEMPYVQRDHKGNITGLFAAPQPQPGGICLTDTNPLPDNDPHVVAFRKKQEAIFGPPPRPMTPEELRRLSEDGERLKREHEEIRRIVVTFNQAFAELETALSALLYSVLNIRQSQVAYAIYYSPSSFDARAKIVDNALIQLVSENNQLAGIPPLQKIIFCKIGEARQMRNTLAHGIQQTLHIQGKSYARFSPLAFDAIRLGRKVAKGQIPGLTADNVLRSCQSVCMFVEHVDTLNRIITAFYDGDPVFQKRFTALRDNLTKPKGLSPSEGV
jgi:hypothetical protein